MGVLKRGCFWTPFWTPNLPLRRLICYTPVTPRAYACACHTRTRTQAWHYIVHSPDILLLPIHTATQHLYHHCHTPDPHYPEPHIPHYCCHAPSHNERSSTPPPRFSTPPPRICTPRHPPTADIPAYLQKHTQTSISRTRGTPHQTIAASVGAVFHGMEQSAASQS